MIRSLLAISLGLIAAAILIASLEPEPAFAATGSGVRLSGTRLSADTDPLYICMIGDPQIGGQCENSFIRWGTSANDAGHQACGQAQADETAWLINDCLSKYPIDLITIAGDMTDSSGQWEVDAIAATLSGFPAAIRDKIVYVGGNHDGDSTNCTRMHRYLSTDFLGDGETAPLVFERRLRHARLYGYQSALVTMGTSTACHAADDPAKYPAASSGGYSENLCYGDPEIGAGADDNGTSCTQDSDCDGRCLLADDVQYDETMDFIASETSKFISTHRDKVLISLQHQALCRGSVAGCPFDATSSSEAFNRASNLLTCDATTGSDEGKYCDLDNGAHTCAITGDAGCTVERTGYETNDKFKEQINRIPLTKAAFVWISGHVGGANKYTTPETDLMASTLPFLVAESSGPWLNDMNPTVHWGSSVLKIEHDGTTSVVEYVQTPNNAPVMDEIGTAGVITMSGGTDSYRFTATDVDYGNLDYHITSSIDGCFALDQMGTLNAQDIVADLDATACTPGTYGPYEVCVSDGLLSGGVPTGNGLSDCEDFQVVIPGGASMDWGDNWGGDWS